MTTFAERHIGVTSAAQGEMLRALGIEAAGEIPLEALMRQAVPESIFTGPAR